MLLLEGPLETYTYLHVGDNETEKGYCLPRPRGHF